MLCLKLGLLGIKVLFLSAVFASIGNYISLVQNRPSHHSFGKPAPGLIMRCSWWLWPDAWWMTWPAKPLKVKLPTYYLYQPAFYFDQYSRFLPICGILCEAELNKMNLLSLCTPHSRLRRYFYRQGFG